MGLGKHRKMRNLKAGTGTPQAEDCSCPAKST
jgi:hypothetical protein